MHPPPTAAARVPDRGDGYEFDRATAVSALGDGRFAGVIHDGWDIGGNANGGYLLAIVGRALREVSGKPDPVTITAHYLAPGVPGPLEISTEIVKSGRRFSTISASVVKDGRRMLQVLAAFGDQSGGTSERLHQAGEPPELPPMQECAARDRQNGMVVAPFIDRIDVRLHPDDVGFQGGRTNGRGELRGWFAFADGRPIDTLGLLLAADAMPPAVFNLDLPKGWVPTVELTVHVRGVPAPGPLRCRFTTRFVQGDSFEEDGEVWDSEGRLVALSRQLALIARA
ncbi:MAG: thioesterase family protein [Acidimicrobiia bacterium]